MSERPSPALLSVVVPCLNEEEVIEATHGRLAAALEPVPDLDFEVVYVDDGSTDGTLAELREISKSDPRARVVSLSRNFGQGAALAAGLRHASGDAAALIDADLQDPPEVLPEMLSRWREGAEIAYGLRTERAGETAFKKAASRLFHRCIARISEAPIPPDVGEFRLMDRVAVDAFLALPERDRLVRALVAWTGFRQTAVPYRREPRAAGETKYSIGKMLALAADGILSFSRAPVRAASWLGLAAAAAALAGSCWAAAGWFFAAEYSGPSVLLLTVVWLGGVQLAAIGLLGEYLARIYGEVKRRPLYLVRETIGFPPPAAGGGAPGGAEGGRAPGGAEGGRAARGDSG